MADKDGKELQIFYKWTINKCLDKKKYLSIVSAIYGAQTLSLTKVHIYNWKVFEGAMECSILGAKM